MFFMVAVTDILDRITIIPDLCSGDPTIRAMRLRVSTVLEALACGATRNDLLESYPSLEDEDITASLAYAARLTLTSAA